MTKLTLSADRELVQKAKRLAARQNTSVSALFDRFIRSATSGDEPAARIGPLTRKASGIIAPRAKADRNILEDALLEKYNL